MPIDTQPRERDSSIWQLLNWEPSETQYTSYKIVQSEIESLNKKVNLTRLIKGDDYWIRQVFDSLWPFKKELENQNLNLNFIDVGTGCGFPGIAIAIAFPFATVTLIDSSLRKTNSLKKIISKIECTNRVFIKTERIEKTGQDIIYRGNFDVAMARAVASAPVVAEYLIPLLKPSGEALLYAGKWDKNAQQELYQALQPLNGIIQKIEMQCLPKQKGIRHIIRLKQAKLCPKIYPRAIGIPAKRPLGL